jgi:transposase
MLQLVPQLRILLAVHPTDFRKGLDSLAALCRGPLQQDPFSGTLFVFRNRTGTALKLVVYDGLGFWLCVRRFSSGKLVWWPATDLTITHIQERHFHKVQPLTRGAAIRARAQ